MKPKIVINVNHGNEFKNQTHLLFQKMFFVAARIDPTAAWLAVESLTA